MDKEKVRRVYKLMFEANRINLKMKKLEINILKTQEVNFGLKLSEAINDDSEYQDGSSGVGGYSNGELGSFEDFEKIVNRVEKELENE